MKKGFTLIELLAVIVILAIIALIATPIVLSIIGDTKNSTTLRSAEFYLNVVEQSIMRKNLTTGGSFSPNTCEIQSNGSLLCDGTDELEVEVNGEVPSSGTITFEKGKITDVNLKYTNSTVTQNTKGELVLGKSQEESICKLIDGEANAIGSKYQCKVKDDMEEDFEDGYYFFVLSHNTDGTTNLIMERNIYYNSLNDESGLANENNTGKVAWYSEGTSMTNIYGPVTAMNYLYNATKSWVNVPNIQMNYEDEGKQYIAGVEGDQGIWGGYGTIITTNNVTRITKNDGTKVMVLTDKEGYTNLKARMPYKNEISNYDSVNKTNAYLYDYLAFSNNIQKHSISGIGGYWTLSSRTIEDDDAGVYFVIFLGWVDCDVFVNGSHANEGDIGVRPVINIKL